MADGMVEQKSASVSRSLNIIVRFSVEPKTRLLLRQRFRRLAEFHREAAATRCAANFSRSPRSRLRRLKGTADLSRSDRKSNSRCQTSMHRSESIRETNSRTEPQVRRSRLQASDRLVARFDSNLDLRAAPSGRRRLAFQSALRSLEKWPTAKQSL